MAEAVCAAPGRSGARIVIPPIRPVLLVLVEPDGLAQRQIGVGEQPELFGLGAAHGVDSSADRAPMGLAMGGGPGDVPVRRGWQAHPEDGQDPERHDLDHEHDRLPLQRQTRRRNSVCPRGTYPGMSCDEYPFASTYEGGDGSLSALGRAASTAPVPVYEQNRQGGAIGSFVVRNNLRDGDKFTVVVRFPRPPLAPFPWPVRVPPAVAPRDVEPAGEDGMAAW
ncbi:MAG: hypothetical protein HY690_07285 [Chloroflexi bacterium]|nr:hypothetical protein [Chloroflexota bacterium]